MISFLLSLSLGQWLNAAGILLVLLGVLFGFLMKPKEYRHSNDPSDLMTLDEFRKGNWKSRTRGKTWEIFWEYVLILGLGIELCALAVSIPEDLKLSQRIEELRKANDELEAKMQPRIITARQRADFKTSLANIRKGQVKIGVRNPDNETLDFVEQVHDLLVDSGFIIESQMNYPGSLVKIRNYASIGIFINSLTNVPPYALPLFEAFTNIGFPAMLVLNGTNQPASNGEIRMETNDVMVFLLEKQYKPIKP
jgi:hypothetical protein